MLLRTSLAGLLAGCLIATTAGAAPAAPRVVERDGAMR
jgi:hypothetical protein